MFFFTALEYRRGPGETADSIYNEFSTGFATGANGDAVLDVSSVRKEVRGEATFICALVKGDPNGSLCLWTDPGVVGFVESLQPDVEQAVDLAAVVRESVEV